MAKTHDLAIEVDSAHGIESGPRLAGAAGLIGLAGIAAAYLAGCNPMAGGDDASGLSGCWSVQDTSYMEAGRTSYDTGTLTLSQHATDLAGGIIWSDPTRPADSVSGQRNGDSLSLMLIEKGFSEGATLKGTISGPDRFYVSYHSVIGSRQSFSASRLAKCPDTLVNPNPRLLRFQAAPDSIAVSHVDSASLASFADYAYFGDSDVVRFSQAYDTLTFTYRSYQDRERGSKSISSPGFSLLTTAQGEKVIYGIMDPYFSDAIIIGDSTRYSLNEIVVVPGGLPKGKYRIVLRVRVGCFCIPGPSDFYTKEFAVE